MAEASITVTVNHEMPLPGKGVLVQGTLAVDASPDTYAAGGLALGSAEFAAAQYLAPGSKPVMLLAMGEAGYLYEYDQSGGKLLIRAQTSSASEDDPLGELAASAIPAACSGDTISFLALFEKFPSV